MRAHGPGSSAACLSRRWLQGGIETSTYYRQLEEEDKLMRHRGITIRNDESTRLCRTWNGDDQNMRAGFAGLVPTVFVPALL